MFKRADVYFLFSVAGLLAVAGLTGIACSRGEQQKAGGGQSTKQYLVVKGSDTMVHLVSSWAEAFMKNNPDVEVSVTGGGSGTGIAALVNGTTDICASSRDMQQKEYDLAGQKGLSPQEFTVARDGIAVIVNPGNPVSELTMEQIAKVYTGAYTNWNQLNGPDQEIIVLSRESSSGTYVFFQEHVLNKKDYTSQARLMPATSAIIQSVAADAWAIGYVGLGYALEAAGQIKMLRVKADQNAPAVIPSEAAVISGEYPIARPLHLYTGGQPQELAQRFIDFSLSSQGQQIVRETGYVAVR